MNLEWSVIGYAVPLLADGLVATVKISVLAIVVGTVVGFVLGLLTWLYLGGQVTLARRLGGGPAEAA